MSAYAHCGLSIGSTSASEGDAVDGSPPRGSVGSRRDGGEPWTGSHDRVGHRKVGLSGARRRRERRGCGPAAGSTRAQVLAVLREAAALPGRDRGLRDGASLGARADQARPRGPADAAELREALCEAAEERRGRCRGDLRGRDPADHALRRGEEPRAAERDGAAPGPADADASAYPALERDPRATWPSSAWWRRSGARGLGTLDPADRRDRRACAGRGADLS